MLRQELKHRVKAYNQSKFQLLTILRGHSANSIPQIWTFRKVSNWWSRVRSSAVAIALGARPYPTKISLDSCLEIPSTNCHRRTHSERIYTLQLLLSYLSVLVQNCYSQCLTLTQILQEGRDATNGTSDDD